MPDRQPQSRKKLTKSFLFSKHKLPRRQKCNLFNQNCKEFQTKGEVTPSKGKLMIPESKIKKENQQCSTKSIFNQSYNYKEPQEKTLASDRSLEQIKS